MKRILTVFCWIVLVSLVFSALGANQSQAQPVQAAEAREETAQSTSSDTMVISAGYNHTCGVNIDGTLSCWGGNEYGQVMPPAGTFKQISAGWYHNCAVKADGTVTCWGNDDDSPTGSFTQVSAGKYHSCGVKTDGTVACWGSNDSGQAAPPAGIFTEVSAGTSHTCGLKSDNTIACWGSNENGQTNPPSGAFTQISSGYDHACGVKSDGTLACWGDNKFKQALPPSGSFKQVGAGYDHTCAVKSDGTLACWGQNGHGQSTPPPGNFVQVTGGYNFTCGVRSDDILYCWGYNHSGQAPTWSLFPKNLPDGFLNVAYFQLLSSSSGVDPYSYKLNSGDLPPGLTLSTDGKLSGTPTAVGTYNFTVLATASGNITPSTFVRSYTLVVFQSLGQLNPIGNQSSLEGAALEFTATSSNTGTSQKLTYSVGAGAPGGASVDPSTGVFRWTPTEAQGPGVYNLTITVTATENELQAWRDSEDLQITVSEVNVAPVAKPDSYTTPEDAPLAINASQGLLTNDIDPDLPANSITAKVKSGPAHGELALTPDGAFVYTPNQDFFGADSFIYSVTDGRLEDTATVALTVTPVEDPVSIEAGEDILNAVEGQVVNFNGSYSDPDGTLAGPDQEVDLLWDFGDKLSASGAGTPSHVFLEDGTYTVTMTITGTTGLVISDQLQVTVANVAPQLPVLSNANLKIGKSFSLATSILDPGLLDEHTVTVVWRPGETETLHLKAGVLDVSLAHAFPEIGIYPVKVEVTDDDGGISSQTFTVTVEPYRLSLPLVLK